MFEQALQSNSIWVLVWTALALGFLHTVLGPDHYVPFAALARAEGWSRPRTAAISAICGLGHVFGSVAIAGVLILLGTAAQGWEHSGWAALHDARGSVVAWALIGVGAAYGLWGVRRALRQRAHTHRHVHADGHEHHHHHDHHHDHVHVHRHEDRAARVTPWVLFIVFVFGPCESLIPLMLAAQGLGGLGATVLTAGAFTVATVGTIIGTVTLLQAGIDLVPLGRLERWTHAAAGMSLVACGAAVGFLGL
jgi:ABC-type nickel/cobalt efflux system permease component RcnA